MTFTSATLCATIILWCFLIYSLKFAAGNVARTEVTRKLSQILSDRGMSCVFEFFTQYFATHGRNVERGDKAFS